MTILRLDLHAGGWRAVSPRLFEDERLSLDTRAVAGYISTRSDSFSLNVSGLCSLLKIGEDKWRRMNTELTNAGYLKRIQGKDKKGRFRHELVFSPIPGQHDLDDLSEKQLRAIPKKPVQPGAVSPETTKPRPAIPGSTRNQMDHISDYHQRGGGMTDPSNLTIPSFWIEAAEYEIEVEGLKKPVQNRSGLFRTIINRYRANGGPDSGVLAELKKKEAAEEMKKERDKAAREHSRLEEERFRVTVQRHAEAEKKAKAISSERRASIFSDVEKNVPIKANMSCEWRGIGSQRGGAKGSQSIA